MGVGRAPAVWLFVVVGEGLRGSLPAGSDLPAPGCLGVEGLLFASSVPHSGDGRGWGFQAGLGVLAVGVAMGDTAVCCPFALSLTASEGTCVLSEDVAQASFLQRAVARWPGTLMLCHSPIQSPNSPDTYSKLSPVLGSRDQDDHDPAPAFQEPPCQWSLTWALPLTAFGTQATLLSLCFPMDVESPAHLSPSQGQVRTEGPEADKAESLPAFWWPSLILSLAGPETFYGPDHPMLRGRVAGKVVGWEGGEGEFDANCAVCARVLRSAQHINLVLSFVLRWPFLFLKHAPPVPASGPLHLLSPSP